MSDVATLSPPPARPAPIPDPAIHDLDMFNDPAHLIDPPGHGVRRGRTVASRRYPDAERRDPKRESSVDIGFGTGPHRRPGSHLAPIEPRIVHEELLARPPGPRLDPDQPVTCRGGNVAGPDKVWLAWEV